MWMGVSVSIKIVGTSGYRGLIRSYYNHSPSCLTSFETHLTNQQISGWNKSGDSRLGASEVPPHPDLSLNWWLAHISWPEVWGKECSQHEDVKQMKFTGFMSFHEQDSLKMGKGLKASNPVASKICLTWQPLKSHKNSHVMLLVPQTNPLLFPPSASTKSICNTFSNNFLEHINDERSNWSWNNYIVPSNW